MPAAEAWQEIAGGRQRIMEMAGIDARHFSPPHGTADTIAAVHRQMAIDAGYVTMTTTRATSLFAQTQVDDFSLPRITVTGGSMPAIACHLSGLTGMMTRRNRLALGSDASLSTSATMARPIGAEGATG